MHAVGANKLGTWMVPYKIEGRPHKPAPVKQKDSIEQVTSILMYLWLVIPVREWLSLSLHVDGDGIL